MEAPEAFKVPAAPGQMEIAGTKISGVGVTSTITVSVEVQPEARSVIVSV